MTEGKELATVDSAPRLVAYIEDAKQAMLAVRTLHSEVLRDGIDFGVIPGTGDKPCLLKPGAESLLMAFQLGVGEPQIERVAIDAPVAGHCEFRVKLPIIHRPSGQIIGYGVGSCSTMEKKYRYRQAERACPDCGKATVIKGKAQYGGGWLCWRKKGGCGATFTDDDKAITSQDAGQIENPDPADQYNTCLKMAKKRALVDGALTSCAASGVFTQDVEEGASYSDPAKPAELVDVPPDKQGLKHHKISAKPLDAPPLMDEAEYDTPPQWHEVWPQGPHIEFTVSRVAEDTKQADCYWYKCSYDGVTALCFYKPTTDTSKAAAKANLVTDHITAKVVSGGDYPRLQHVKFTHDTADCPPPKGQLTIDAAEVSGPLSPGD